MAEVYVTDWPGNRTPRGRQPIPGQHTNGEHRECSDGQPIRTAGWSMPEARRGESVSGPGDLAMIELGFTAMPLNGVARERRRV